MQGTFIWYELMPTDAPSAVEFYTKVVGWTAKDSGMPGYDYTILGIPGYDMGVAGVMQLTDEMKAKGVPPNWAGYVAVDDVDAMAQKFADNGGTVRHAPEDIPGVGRFAVVADPQGAVISLLKVIMPEGPMPPEPPFGTPGAFGWTELMAGNAEEAFAFYQKMFGWEKDMAVDMGEMGTYQCFAKNGKALGGMMTKPPMVSAPFWGYYITVDAIDAAAERVRQGGGKILFGPEPVPGGSFILQCQDPQGTYFALSASKR